MGYNFTDETRSALEHARAEAGALGHEYIGTEHLLLSLTAGPKSEAMTALRALSVDTSALRQHMLAIIPRERAKATAGRLPHTSRAKKALELAMAQARGFGSHTVGTDHLLLGIFLEEKGVGGQALRAFDVTLESLIAAIRKGRAPARLELRIDDKSEEVIYEQIVTQVHEAIATGRLSPGDRLPPVRQVADDLGIAPGTVARAYSILEESKAVTTEGARGTFVAAREEPQMKSKERNEAVHALLRQVVVAAFHLGAGAGDLRNALEQAMKDIYGPREGEAA